MSEATQNSSFNLIVYVRFIKKKVDTPRRNNSNKKNPFLFFGRNIRGGGEKW